MFSLDTPYQEIIAKLGNPVEEKVDGDMRLLLYNSPSMTLADIYYVQGDKLVAQSFSSYENPKLIGTYISDYGTPKQSIQKFSQGTPDSLFVVVHIWPEEGRAVTTTGQDMMHVIREDQFAPTTLEQYLATWGKQLVGHEQVTIPTNSLVPAIPTHAMGMTLVLGAIAFILIVRRFLRRGQSL